MINDLKHKLAHVYWIGGSPCSGKSSIANLLAVRRTLASSVAVYHCDDHFDQHLKQTRPEKQPEFYRIKDMSWDDLWMRDVVAQFRHEVAIYREEFLMILADLLKMPNDRPILAEGAALLPELVAEAAQAGHAFYVAPTPEFQWRTYEKRPWIREILDQCRDPEQAFKNWMLRDIYFAGYVVETAVTLNYPVIHVDGSRSIDANAVQIAHHFGW